MRPFRPAGALPGAAAALAGLALVAATAAADDVVSRPPAAAYDLPLGEAHAAARAAGWRFGAEAANPASVCRLAVEGGALVLSAARARGTVDAVCDFVLFAGERTLAPGWGISGFERTRTDRPSCGYRFPRFPVEGGAALAFHIRILARAAREAREPEQPCAYAIRRIVLRGPAGADWRDAFRP